MQLLKYTVLLLSFGLVFLQYGCQDDTPIIEPSAKLEFSVDTLTFDTVFTAIGSATRLFRVYNRHEQPIIISSIQLDGGENSKFRINIDGVPTPIATDIEIAASDSLYIFAEVTIDPTDESNPYVIRDYITFETNGNTQQIVLEAWGQNALYVGTKGGFGLLSCNGGTETWDFDRPVVVYGWLIIDDCQLELAAGTEIYVHGALVNPPPDTPYNDGVLFFTENGSLKINGTADNPVVLQGDRLEEGFAEGPGQWGGIVFGQQSKGNEINHAIIKNSIIGVRVDSLAALNIQNSMIHNTASSGLIGNHAEQIYAENCLFFSSAGGNNVQLEFGGNYDFRYCTMASFSSVNLISHSAPVLRMTNVSCQDLFCQEFEANPLNATFTNCIIYGSRVDEISLFDRVSDLPGYFNFTFDNCLIKSDDTESENDIIFDNCNNCVLNEDPIFADINEFNYQLDSLTPANAVGIPINSLITNTPLNRDIEGTLRDASTPDLGCYEYFE